MGWLTITMDKSDAKLEALYRLLPSFITMSCWSFFAIYLLCFNGDTPPDTILSKWLLYFAFGVPAIMFVIIDAPGGLIAATLSGINLGIWYFTQSTNNHATSWLIATCIITTPIAFTYFLLLRTYLKKSIATQASCRFCQSSGRLSSPTKWLTTPYTGKCYVCLGKNQIKIGHPHFEASQILDKYEAGLTETTKEFENLEAVFHEMSVQKQQGLEVLGNALYQQTIDLEKQYYDQAELRKTQIEFFEQGLRKLHRMMYNSMLADNMLQKQKELATLYDDNAKDLGSVMSLKAQLEMHHDVIDRINALSIQIDQQASTSIAAELSKEIEEMQEQL